MKLLHFRLLKSTELNLYKKKKKKLEVKQFCTITGQGINFQFFKLFTTNGLKAGGNTIYIKWKEEKKTRGQEHRKAEERDVTVKRLKSFSVF